MNAVESKGVPASNLRKRGSKASLVFSKEPFDLIILDITDQA